MKRKETASTTYNSYGIQKMERECVLNLSTSRNVHELLLNVFFSFAIPSTNTISHSTSNDTMDKSWSMEFNEEKKYSETLNSIHFQLLKTLSLFARCRISRIHSFAESMKKRKIKSIEWKRNNNITQFPITIVTLCMFFFRSKCLCCAFCFVIGI